MHIIGVPYLKEVNITCHIKEKHFTAVLELGDMFYGGRVLIDHYIIQVEDGTVLETPGPTYSFDIMYNTSLAVNISAHNCAGYSDPFSLVLQYDKGIHQLQTLANINISKFRQHGEEHVR